MYLMIENACWPRFDFCVVFFFVIFSKVQELTKKENTEGFSQIQAEKNSLESKVGRLEKSLEQQSNVSENISLRSFILLSSSLKAHLGSHKPLQTQ